MLETTSFIPESRLQIGYEVRLRLPDRPRPYADLRRRSFRYANPRRTGAERAGVLGAISPRTNCGGGCFRASFRIYSGQESGQVRHFPFISSQSQTGLAKNRSHVRSTSAVRNARRHVRSTVHLARRAGRIRQDLPAAKLRRGRSTFLDLV